MKAVQAARDALSVGPALASLGLNRATFYRWATPSPPLVAPVETGGDRSEQIVPASQEARCRVPGRSLDRQEREAVRQVLYGERFMDDAPAQVFAQLLDEGTYLCSIRTMYRLLKADGADTPRAGTRQHPVYQRPELLATRPNELWSWDITRLKGPRPRTYFQLYVILDVFSRYVVGWMVAHHESQELARQLIDETLAKQGILPGQLTIHADRGAAMTSKSVALLLSDLGVIKTHSRPHVSNDNPYSEAHFRTLKYRPQFPARFGSIEEARNLCGRLFTWYNGEHRHGSIALLTPAMVHYGKANEVIAQRQRLLDAAYQAHPERFVQGPPCHAALPQAVWINPPLEKAVADEESQRASSE